MKKSFGKIVRTFLSDFDKSKTLVNSRKTAVKLRKAIVKNLGREIVDKSLESKIRSYAVSRFGDPEYRHWLILYSEIVGKFKDGWIGEDYYRVELLPEWNKPQSANLSILNTFNHRLFKKVSLQPLVLRISGICYTPEMERITSNEFLSIVRSYKGKIAVKCGGLYNGKRTSIMKPTMFKFNAYEEESDLLVQPYAQRHSEMADIYNNSVNTLLITTFLTDTGGVQVKHRLIRAGGASGQKNMNSYYCCFFLNSEGEGITGAYNENGLIIDEYHPDSNLVTQEFKHGSISEAETLCEKAHLMFPYIRFIEWELYFEKEESPVVIEWNAYPDIWLSEAVVGPLWLDGWD